jgi:anti-anti-sigma factor
VLVLPEHIDLSNSGEIRGDLLAVINRGPAALIADMTATASCDHSGIDALARVHQRAVISGTDLRLVVTSPVVRRVLASSGIDRLVPVYASRTAALAARAPAAARARAQAAAARTSPAAAGNHDSGDIARHVGDDRDLIAALMNEVVVRRLFSAGLSLRTAVGLLGDHPATGRVHDAVADLDHAIRELRNVVFHRHAPHSGSEL